MASPQLFLCIIFFFFIHQSLAMNSTLQDHHDGYYPKVELSVYYESLCPYCSNFILNGLVNVFKKNLISIVNLRLVPWGNAALQDKQTVVCQHGQAECTLNAVEACVIKVWPDVRDHFSYVHCIESNAIGGNQIHLASCFGSQQVWQPVQQCYNSGDGKQLLLKYGDETAHLNPPHQFVPWVVVDQKPIYNDYGNFLTHVCRAYKGPKPEGCKSLLSKTNLFEEANHPPQVCYAKDAKKSTLPAN